MTPRPLLDRLADKFTVGDGCWEWTAAKRRGYGAFRMGGRRGGMKMAHRVVYELLVGPIPEGFDLDHLCRNTSCVRPDHTEPVTHQENARRGIAGKLGALHQAGKTHCPHGHPYDEQNTRVYRAKRHCRACGRISTRKHYDAQKAVL